MLSCFLHRGHLFGDYRFFQQREIRDIGCYIGRSLAGNAYMPLFQVNALPRLVHSVVPLMKLCLIYSSVALTKSLWALTLHKLFPGFFCSLTQIEQPMLTFAVYHISNSWDILSPIASTISLLSLFGCTLQVIWQSY